MTQLNCYELCHTLVQSEVFLVVKKKLNLCMYDKWYFCSQQKNFFKFCSSFFFLFFHDNDKFVENIEFSSICAECIISSLRPDNLKMGYFSHVLSVDN